MNLQEIIDAVKKAIMSVSDVSSPDEIDLDDDLQQFVNPNVKMFLASQLCSTFPKLPFNKLCDDLFTKIIIVAQLVTYINNIYKN